MRGVFLLYYKYLRVSI